MIREPREPRGASGDSSTPAASPTLATKPEAGEPDMQIADALRLLRTRQDLSQAAASRLEGAPNVRTICHWETGRKLPTLKLLLPYLRSLGLDLVDLQDALNEVLAPHPTGCRADLEHLKQQIAEVQRRLSRVEQQQPQPAAGGPRVVRAVRARPGHA